MIYVFREEALSVLLRHALEGREVSVERLEVKKLGWWEQALVKGDVGWRGQGLQWEEMAVRWAGAGPVSGRLESIAVTGPRLQLSREGLRRTRRPLEIRTGPGEPATGKEERTTALAAKETATGGTGEPAVEERAAGAEAKQKNLRDPGSWLPLALPVKPMALGERVPARVVRLRSGELQVSGWKGFPEEWDWEALLEKTSDQWEGFVSGRILDSEVRLEIQVDRLSEQFTVHGSGALGPGLISVMAESEPFDEWAAGLTPDASLRADLLVEGTAAQVDGLSGEVWLDSLGWRGQGVGEEVQAELGSSAIAFALRPGRLQLEAGAQVEQGQWGEWSVAPFGVRLYTEAGKRVSVESERVAIRGNGWTGGLAIRGNGEPFREGLPFRVECSLERWHHANLQVEPFSLLVEGDMEQVELRLSPVGLVRNGTLWLEAGEGSWRAGRFDGSGEIYGLAGEKLGQWQGTAGQSGLRQLQWFGAGGAELGKLEWWQDEEEGLERGTVEGSIPGEWVETALRWWGEWPVRMKGGSFLVQAEVELGAGRLPRGTGRFALEKARIKGDGEWDVRDVTAELDWTLYGLPRTREPAQVQIGSIEGLPVAVEDLHIEWEAPHWREIAVMAVTGRMEGSAMELDGFRVDPLAPEFATRLRLDDLAANRVLELLGEERFALEGNLSGVVEFAYRDATVHLGPGRLALAAGGAGTRMAQGRLLFQDESFVREQLGKLAGIPSDAREKVIATLLENGLRLDELTVELLGERTKKDALLRLTIRGEARSEDLVLPIDGLVLNNRIPIRDLARLLGLEGELSVGTAGQGLP